MNWADPLFWEIVLAAAVRLATPIMLAAVGETVVERGGTINLGIDGMMLMGALAGCIGASIAGWPAGIVAGALVGTIAGSGMAAAILIGRANQIVVGIAISVLGTGLTKYVFQLWQPPGSIAPPVPLVPTVAIPVLADIPWIGPVLFKQSLLTYGCLALIAVGTWALRRTRAGLILRATGDAPEAIAFRGINPVAVRTLTLAFGGMLAGIGGAAVTVGYLGAFSDGVIAGRGYVALAIVIIGRWSPVGAAFGAMLFAFFDSFALRMQSGGADIPVEVYVALPYAATLVALVITMRGNIAPRALGRPLEDAAK